ncbi:MAG: hypothetical protein EOM23_05205, partial [Candidatus Moranbacteria bacterium]|nr:hypothetical protein [Candidatus Moranbacteria bacterium]
MKKTHTMAICVAACVFIGGSAVTLSSYCSAKNELLASQQELMEVERSNRKLEQTSDALQEEHTDYNQNIESLQEKAAELEQKINELENVKNNLNDQLDNISTNDSASAEIYNAVASCFVEAQPPTADFTPIV